MISSRVPATGEGISVSTLSVETSSNGSSTSTWSPTSLSQRVTVPSVTLSPSSGMVTAVPASVDFVLAFGFSAGSSTEPDGASAFSSASACGSAVSSSSAESLSAESSSADSASCSSSAESLSCEPSSDPPSSEPSPITASSPPTSTVSSSPATIRCSTPEAGEGISVSTLSVETSSNGSSTSTWSPSCLSHRVTVPSVTLSPRAGI